MVVRPDQPLAGVLATLLMLAVLIGLSALSYTLLGAAAATATALARQGSPTSDGASWLVSSPHAAPMQDQHVVGAAQVGLA